MGLSWHSPGVGRASTSRGERLRSAGTWSLAISGPLRWPSAGRRLPARRLAAHFGDGPAGQRGERCGSLPEQLPQPTVALTTSRNLLATTNALVRFLKTARPKAVSAEDRARVLRYPPSGRRSHRPERRGAAETCRPQRDASGQRARVGAQIKVVAVPQAGLVCMRKPSSRLGSRTHPAGCRRTPGLGGPRNGAG